jgi:hypothetical protein
MNARYAPSRDVQSGGGLTSDEGGTVSNICTWEVRHVPVRWRDRHHARRGGDRERRVRRHRRARALPITLDKLL